HEALRFNRLDENRFALAPSKGRLGLRRRGVRPSASPCSQSAGGDLSPRLFVRVSLGDAEIGPPELENGEVRDSLAMREAVTLVHEEALSPTALDELQTEPALSDSRRADDPDDLPASLESLVESALEDRELAVAAYEP